MSKFHLLMVKSIQRETADAVSVTFDIPENLRSNFHFTQGQYVTLRLPVDGKFINRSYSICSNPYSDKDITVAVKKVESGIGSTYVCDRLKSGDSIEVMEPMGSFFTPLDAKNAKHYILFGGGSGITPMMSIVKSVLQVEPQSKLTLFYGNRDENSIIFKSQFEALSKQYENRFKLVYILDKPSESWNGYKGIMDDSMNLKLLKENTDLNFSNVEFFICGPGPMMQAAKRAIETLGVLARHIHIEYFTAKDESERHTADVGSSDVEHAPITDGKTTVTIILDGKEISFEMRSSETVLEAALDKGYDPPYSCMVAACCTCRAKLKAGSVKMDDRESLTDSEIAQGYVLTCQSHPTTHGVVLSYDE